jgi:hypothetical protein
MRGFSSLHGSPPKQGLLGRLMVGSGEDKSSGVLTIRPRDTPPSSGGMKTLL